MSRTQIQEFARLGARARLDALHAERDEILRMFPELRAAFARDGAGASEPPRRGGMSSDARRRQAERMRAYWADRRAQKETPKRAAKKAEAPASKKGGRMSAEARQRQAARMKAYWAAKRAEKQNTGEGAQAEAGADASPKITGRKGRRRQGRKK